MKQDVFLSDEPMLETLDYTIRIGSTPTFSYFDFLINKTPFIDLATEN